MIKINQIVKRYYPEYMDFYYDNNWFTRKEKLIYDLEAIPLTYDIHQMVNNMASYDTLSKYNSIPITEHTSLILGDLVRKAPILNYIFKQENDHFNLYRETQINRILYLNRLDVIHSFYAIDQSLVNNNTRALMAEYIQIGFEPTRYDVRHIKCELDNFTEVAVDNVYKKVQEQCFGDPELIKLARIMTTYNNHCKNELLAFDKAYDIFQKILARIVFKLSLSIKDKSEVAVLNFLKKEAYPIPITSEDYQLVFNLIRVNYCETKKVEPYPLPLFDGTQEDEIDDFLDETLGLLITMHHFCEKFNYKYNCWNDVLRNIPESFLINKSTEEFFGQEISKTTYNLLIHYIFILNISLIKMLREQLYYIVENAQIK